MKKYRFLLLAAIILLPFSTMAQEKKQFTLDDLIPGGKTFWNLYPEYTFCEWNDDMLMEMEVDTVFQVSDTKGKLLKQRRAFITLDEINAGIDTEKYGKVRNLMRASFDYPGQSVITLQSDKGKIQYDWKTKQVVWYSEAVGGTKATKFEKGSRNLAYVKDNNLFVRTADGTVTQLTADGTRELVYGQSVHRDEFGITEGLFWSPRGNRLAFYRMDQSMVADYPQVDIFKREATYEPDKYPMAGMTSHKVTVGIYDVATKKTVYLDAGDPTDRYFSNISWAPDEKTIYMIELPRSQDKAELVSYDAQTGARLKVLYTETHPKYVHPVHPITFLPWNDKQFIYQTERDGYNHLYLFDTNGNEIKQLTKGNFVVQELVGFNSKAQTVIIRSTESSPIRSNYWSVSVKNGKRQLLDGGEGVHNGELSPSGRYLMTTWTSPKVTRRYDLVSAEKVSAPQTLLDSRDPWQEYDVPEITGGSIKAADGTTDLYYRLVKPTHFDPSKKYPTVVYVYGGPGIRNVEETRNYDARGWEIYMAQKGYVIFVLDNRGSSDRGFEFESCTFRHLGDEEMKDQMKGVEFLKSLPYVDADRIGVHGWSFGGFMTTNLMLTYPETFKVGVAGGPVIDWKYYEVMYGERYMDTPEENPEGYKNTSLLNKAGNLKGRLQVIIGYNDPTCVPQHSLSFLNACMEAGTQPDFFAYPGQGHNMIGISRVHLHDRITRYFEDYLKGGCKK